MTKTFCDRCKGEITDVGDCSRLEATSHPSVNRYELCPDCATALRAWLGEKKDE